MHCVMGADSCQSVFDTRGVTSSSQCRGEDAVAESQRRSVNLGLQLPRQDAEGFSFELKSFHSQAPGWELSRSFLLCVTKK